jgi:hypothetical protein
LIAKRENFGTTDPYSKQLALVNNHNKPLVFEKLVKLKSDSKDQMIIRGQTVGLGAQR